ncbi:pseudouridine synthase A [Seminavis robusta]|uniref:Pseudouridine synthase A n=1 Tax=Seminavis robusta TaxID=568900 RepID=A0A9N8DL21_9STRA|nr:pseudouridine synthase A [Seminavis robusta]|eukprot:Sro138_g064810.1 pseudouridine synthase A (516) ;mRNA; r:76178-77725
MARQGVMLIILMYFLLFVGRVSGFLPATSTTSWLKNPSPCIQFLSSNSDSPQPPPSNSNDKQYNTYQKQPQLQEISREERVLQDLWNQNPFSIANQVVKSVIVDNASSSASPPRPPPLREEDNQHDHYNHCQLPREDYQELFGRLLDAGDGGGAEPKKDTTAIHIHPPSNKNTKAYRASFRLDIAYRGDAFCGWQTNPNNPLPSVQKTLEDWLQPLLYERPKKRRQKAPQKRVDLRSAGRTDAGVHAVGQVSRFRTWISSSVDNNSTAAAVVPANNNATSTTNHFGPSSVLPPEQIIWEHLQQHPRAGLDFACVAVTPVSSKFHPTFGANCRAYLYVVDVPPIQQLLLQSQQQQQQQSTQQTTTLHDFLNVINQLLKSLVVSSAEDDDESSLDFIAMSYGKVETQSTQCRLTVARAFLASTSTSSHDHEEQALCIQLVGDRFLRRMVRILVATVLREALTFVSASPRDDDDDPSTDAGSSKRRLVELLETKDRRQTARPAPPQGLIFSGAQFQVQ